MNYLQEHLKPNMKYTMVKRYFIEHKKDWVVTPSP